MTTGSVSQSNLSAGGDIAGGDIVKNTVYLIQPPKTQLQGLIEQLREKIKLDPEAAEFVESLLRWINPKKTSLTRDLSEKLKACGRSNLVPDALEAKERFTKQLTKTAFNPALQEIYACILGELYIGFTHRIKPKISAAQIPGEIETAIADLAETITKQISNAPPSLGIGIREIVGMLYFLTGNCHIDWDNTASLPPGN